MNCICDKYVKVLDYKGYSICTLKKANPTAGDKLGYVIDDETFNGNTYNLLDKAVSAINQKDRRSDRHR